MLMNVLKLASDNGVKARRTNFSRFKDAVDRIPTPVKVATALAVTAFAIHQIRKSRKDRKDEANDVFIPSSSTSNEFSETELAMDLPREGSFSMPSRPAPSSGNFGKVNAKMAHSHAFHATFYNDEPICI